jgi:hypothetical protein
MHLFFLIPLLTALLTSYIFQKSSDEMAYLTGIITVVSSILCLALAPWQLQLLVLGIVFLSTRKLLRQNESRMQLENSKKEELN